MTKIKHTYQGREFRGEWSEDECRLTLRYEGPEGTLQGTTTIGGDGRLMTMAGSFRDSSTRISKDEGAKEVADGLCLWILHEYRQKYEMLGKKDACDLMSEWAAKNPD